MAATTSIEIAIKFIRFELKCQMEQECLKQDLAFDQGLFNNRLDHILRSEQGLEKLYVIVSQIEKELEAAE